MAGHSKWANIRIRKGKQDALRGNLFTKLSRELIVAAKAGGGDPNANARLRAAIAKAKSSGMPNDSIQKAIDKAIGGSDASALEEIVYEGKGPGGVGIMIKVLTDNRNRTVPELRHALSKSGGSLVDSGSISWQFRSQGEVVVSGSAADEEKLTLLSLESGAEDIVYEDGLFTIITPVEAFHKVRDTIEEAGFKVERADLALSPTQKVEIDHNDASALLKLLDRLDELDDVQDTYVNADLPDDLEV